MKRGKKLALVLILLFISAISFGQVNQPLPNLKSRVTDRTNTLTKAEITSLESNLKAFESEFGSQVVVVIVSTTKPETIEQYSIKLAEKWKIGREDVDDGVILLIAKEDKKLRIEVGYGLEGAIPDAYAKRIIEQIIVPEFRGGDFYHGITKGIDAIENLIRGEELPVPIKSSSKWKEIFGDGQWLYPFTVILAGLINWFLKSKLGKIKGSMIFFGALFLFVWIVSSFFVALFISIVFTVLFGFPGGGGYGGGYGGGWSSGGGSWGSGGGGFSGGGGSFGGGGASGGW